ncbi:MAG: radical SAM protein [Sulfolobales archaeon]
MRSSRKVKRPLRDLEVNIIYRNPLKVISRIAFIYPSLYQVMLTSLATDLIYHIVNSREDVYLERFYSLKLVDDEKDPRSIETDSPLRDFDLYISSISYELDIVNLINILEAGGIDPFRKRRDKPLVVGGPGVMSNPIPFADIVDVFIIGEIEDTLNEVIDLWIENKDDKKRFLEEVAELEYVYVPDFKESAVRRYVKNLDSAFYPIKQIENLEIEPVYGRGIKLELSRGCKFWCSFCGETRLFQPYRERGYERLKEIVEEGLRYTISGKRVILYTLLIPASKNQLKFLEYLANEGFKASIPSIRLDTLFLYSDDFFELVKKLGQRTLTVAPESFLFKLHRVYMKYLSNENILIEHIKDIINKGFDLKIYLIYGSKWETTEDVKRNIEYIKQIYRYAKEKKRRISISLNPLIPKPKTVFQWLGMRALEDLEEMLNLYIKELRGLVDTRPLDIRWAYAQAFISMANKPLGNLLVRWSRSGRRINALINLLMNLKDSQIIEIIYNGYKYGEVLPWDRVIIGESVEEVTAKQYEAIVSLIGRLL